MPNAVLDQIRQKFPEYRGYADDVLAKAISEKFPEYRPYLREFLGTPASVQPSSASVVPQTPTVQPQMAPSVPAPPQGFFDQWKQAFGFDKPFVNRGVTGALDLLGTVANIPFRAVGGTVESIASKIPGVSKYAPQIGQVAEIASGAAFPAVQARLAKIPAELAAVGREGALALRPGITAPQSILSRPGGLSATPPGISDAAQRVMDAVRVAKPVRAATEAAYSAERSKRLGQALSIGEQVPGEAGFHQQLGALKGELPKPQFESLRGTITQTDIDALINQVEASPAVRGFDKIRAKGALDKLFASTGGQVPQENEIALLERVFGKPFVQTILAKRGVVPQLMDTAAQVLGVPRAIMASTDLSAPMRQGIFLGPRYPRQFFGAFKDMFKSLGSERAFTALKDSIIARPSYEAMQNSGLALTGLQDTALGLREEAFLSNLAERIPGIGRIVRASDRAYTGFLTKLRADVFDHLLEASRRTGVEQTTALTDSIAKFVNSASGRGDLGGITRAGGILSSALFSPKLLASRINLLNPLYYASLEPFVRKQALQSLFAFATAGITTLGLAKAAGAEVGADPRNADFGKIKVGNTRLDIWGGFQQYPRLAAQMLSGKIISSTTGREYTLGEGYKPITRYDIVARFFESKANPIVGFAINLMKQRDFAGQPLNVPDEVKKLVVPLVVQDAIDLYKEDPRSVPFIVPGIFGVGVQTYGKPKR